MTLRRQTAARWTVALVALVALAACTADPAAPAVVAPLATFGPESLAISLALSQDTIAPGAEFRAVAVAANRTARPIVARLQSSASGLTFRVFDDQRLVATSGWPIGMGDFAGTTTLQPGDSVSNVLTASITAATVIRVQAVYEAVGGRSVLVERPIVVRRAPPASLPCTANIVFGVNVSVRDARTGGLVRGAVVVADEGAFREVLAPGPGIPGEPAALSFYGVQERPGTYRVTVQAPGYKDWVQEVVVAAGTCHVTPALVNAALDPAS